MRRRQPILSFSRNDDRDGSDIRSCFDAEDKLEETDADTEPTDIDIGGCNKVDLAWIAGDDNAYPLKYYLDQENDSNESEDKGEDYSESSFLLNRIKAQFYYIKFYPKI
ncbi:hypothetical protein LHYA1_G003305 [Lachnellula hyalina]|uniref:Uncharacterized protein n=1 Tax=Lachnellula hyalina TaxID=1316788 RepID=A0A8H8R7K1_9HELO|nr:uncharacterized protein LHYA1_G003305 [Lachnellula hyalina]TVY28264.1 hypothetical protein LHYA1_G003305 [Lachnellula hyalina]